MDNSRPSADKVKSMFQNAALADEVAMFQIIVWHSSLIPQYRASWEIQYQRHKAGATAPPREFPINGVRLQLQTCYRQRKKKDDIWEFGKFVRL
jgi:hypothetical protein